MSNLKNILNSFKIKNNLCPDVWDTTDKGYILKKKIREKLLQIAYEFFDSLGVDVIISDITFTGSLANFNWSNFSDIDLHLIADFKQFDEKDLELYKELFLLKKTIFNDKHDITILGYEVELYVQDENEEHTSTGVYSVLNDSWIVEPKKEIENIDVKFIKKKTENWMKEIDSVIELSKEESLDDAKKIIKKLKEKIKKYRSCGLEKGGEYSIENLVFKVLRRNGYIEKLFDTSNKLVDDKLSIKEEEEVKDPNLSTSEKSDVVDPDVEKFFKDLESINTNVYQQESGGYTYQKEVELIQIALDLLGYPLPKYGVDGKFGPETAKAVNDFKEDNDIDDKTSIDESYNKILEAYEDIPVIVDTYDNITFANRTTGDRLPKNLLDDLQDAAKNAGITISVNWAKSGHNKFAKSGYVSRHWLGQAVDVSTVNGKTWSSVESAKKKEIYDGIERFVALLKNKGYNINSERGHEKALLYFGFPGHDNHLHISNRSDVPSVDEEPINQEEGGFFDKIKGFFSNLIKPEDITGKSFVSPTMIKKLIEKLKEKKIKTSDLQKYTNVENKKYPVELITGDVKIKGNFSGQQLKNIQLMIDKLNEIGITNPYAQVGVLSVIGKESQFIPKNEGCHENSSNSYLRSIFKERLDDYDETELTELKKDCEEFFDVVYGKDANIGWNTGNTEKGDGFKYRGRGFNQITFKHNYKKFGDIIGVDLVSDPDKLNDVNFAAEAAVKFFKVNAKGKIPNFDNKEDAIEFFANINAGGGKSSHLESALESGKRFDVVV